MMISPQVAQLFRSANCACTLTPFLYQTRTLCSVKPLLLCPSRQSFVVRKSRHFCRSQLQRSNQGYDGHAANSNDTASSTSLESNSGGRVESEDWNESEGRIAGKQHTSWAPLATNSNPQVPIPEKDVTDSTESYQPLYKVMKGLETQSNPSPAEIDSDGDFEHVYEDIDFDTDMDKDSFVRKDEIAELTRNQPLGESTITDSERYAFQKIFRDIFGKNQGSKGSINDVFSATISPTTSLTNETATTSLGARKMSRHEMEEMVSRYPAPLQAAAARAIGLVEVEAEKEDDVQDIESELDLERLEKLREPERRRVETLMQDAKTDFELWEVMEKEVFSLIHRLGLKDMKAEEPQKSKGKRGKSKKGGHSKPSASASAAPTQLQSFAVNEEGLSPLALYGPLYPSHLLLGLRLLDRSFAKSSSLTLALLPKIKSLGLISHVLGASSQLYNELLRIHRYRYDDYRGMLALLKEMEHSGIEFDKETLDIVKDIQRTQLSVRRGEKGPVLQALWSLPEFAPNKFKIWYDKIGGDINARELSRESPLRY